LGAGFEAARGEAALDTLTHRGPDGRGSLFDERRGLFLGQRRLAIIDLSDGGKQPMSNEDGTLHLVFNGEIYNFAALREGLVERGHSFRGHCDAEVVLHLYEEKGAALLDDLVGMFAFALYDTARERMFLARDRLGIKPLYWYQDERLFAFASELKAIEALPGIDRTPDATAYYDYLTYRFVPAPKTILKRAHKLPAGHLLELEGGVANVKPWWTLDFEPEEGRTFEDALEELDALLDDVVRDHLVSDVEVGSFLSSGVDSSLVTTVAKRLTGAAPRSFTISFPDREKDEVEGAGHVAGLLGCEQKVGRFTSADALELVGSLNEVFDEPFADHAALPMLRLCELAARDVKVVLSGDGGDETHAGYGRYVKGERRDRVFSALDAVPLVKRAVARGPALRVPWMRDLLEEPRGRRHAFHAGIPRETKLLFLDLGSELKDYDDYWLLRERGRPDLSPLARQQHLDLTTLLPEGHLTKVDRTSMRHGLEVRPPLLDHRMVEFAARLPDTLRRRDGRGKPLLRSLLLRHLPGFDSATPKLGFSVPIKHFMVTEGLFLSETDVDVFGAFRVDRARLDRVLSPQRNSMELWTLWVLRSFLARRSGTAMTEPSR
jgi:asparagine synthase (glutamine-hydrolysing)